MFKPLFWLFRVSGLSPKNNTTDKYLTVTALLVGIPSITFETVYWNIHRLDTTQGFFSNAAGTMYVLSTFSSVATAHCRKEVFSELMRRLNRVDEGRRHVTRNYEPTIFITFLMILIIRSLALALKPKNVPIIIDLVVLNFFTYSSVTVPLLQLVVVVLRLRARFSSLNDRLRAVSQVSSLNNIRAELMSVFREHADLRDLVADVNSYYGMTVIFSVSARLIFTCERMYSMLITISDPTATDSLPFISVLTAILTIVCLVTTCHTCSEKANNAVFIAHRLIHPNSPIELMDDVERFSLGLFNNPVRFTAGGVFALDRGLITKTVASAVAYLIIAIQLNGVYQSSTTTTESASVGLTTVNTTSV